MLGGASPQMRSIESGVNSAFYRLRNWVNVKKLLVLNRRPNLPEADFAAK